jgi:hypothetical protein
MYPSGCADLSLQYLAVYKGTTRLDYNYYYDQMGFSTIDLGNLAAGKYEIEVDPSWGKGTVPDYVVSTFAFDHPLHIVDSNGNANQVHAWDEVNSTLALA